MKQLDTSFSVDDFNGLSVTVMGLGQFGGGVAVVRFLCEHGALVTLTDRQTEEQLRASLNQLQDVHIEKLVLGEHDPSDVSECDLIIANPAVPPDNDYLAIATAAEIPIETEISLFWRFQKGKTVCVTGSNGKSTTTSLIYEMLNRSANNASTDADKTIWLGGNIGRSLLSEITRIQPNDVVVLELSSFQLHYLNRLKIQPSVSVVTNFSANHLDWHGTIDHYRSSKQAIVRWQNRSDVAVVPSIDDDVDHWPMNATRRSFGLADQGEDGVFACDGHVLVRLGRTEEAVRWPDCSRLPGHHNRLNVAAAICAAVSAGANLSDCVDAVKEFKSLPHRLQFVATIGDRRFYNDSISTTPESTCAAVDAFPAPIVLLAGGYDKQTSLDNMAAKIATRCKAVVLMGQTGKRLQKLINAHQPNAAHANTDQPNPQQPISNVVASSFEDAVRSAYELSEAGDIVILSPGCASYDWFANFQERGDRFCQLVAEL